MTATTPDDFSTRVRERAAARQAAMTPEQRAAADREVELMRLEREKPTAQKILEAAARYDRNEARKLFDEQHVFALRDDLTEDDYARMRELRRLIDFHPLGCYGNLENLIPLRGHGPEWLETYTTELLWERAWWADHYGEPVETTMRRGTLDRPQYVIDAVIAALPYPEGWKPKKCKA